MQLLEFVLNFKIEVVVLANCEIFFNGRRPHRSPELPGTGRREFLSAWLYVEDLL